MLNFLIKEKELKQTEGFLLGNQVRYIRGVNFHHQVLVNAKKVQALLPSFTNNDLLPQLETVTDSIKLGQLMILSGVLMKIQKHTQAHCQQPLSFYDKYPTYFDNDAPIFTYDGYYFQPDQKDEQSQKLGLGGMSGVIFALIFYDHWPRPLKIVTWYALVSAIIAYSFCILAKVALGFLLYLIGVNFWLFPNYFCSFVNPVKMLVPVAKLEVRSDICNPVSLFFRVCCAALIVHATY